MNRLMVATGGTGGHVFPALAVVGAVKRLRPECEVLFMGGSGPEGEMCAKAGVPFKALPAKGVLGRGLAGLAGGLWIVAALAKAVAALSRFRPQAAVGFGGYAGLAPILAARLMGVPTAVHEQNSMPGMTNRVLSRVVRRVFASFADQAGCFPPDKTEVTGNPVRPEIARLAGEARKAPGRNLLVLGGSQGAVAVNDAVIDALPELAEAGIAVRHQTGAGDFERVRRAYEQGGFDAGGVSPFIIDMAGAYAEADLAVCRAGASTVFEIAAAGLPAVYVPFPHATHGHQALNAAMPAEAGAARVLLQEELKPGVLAGTVIELVDDPEALRAMGRAAKGLAAPEAAETIARGIFRLAGTA